MNTRKTDVAWDPKLVRVEYLDEEGNPYYCSFDACDRTPETEVKQATAESTQAAGQLHNRVSACQLRCSWQSYWQPADYCQGQGGKAPKGMVSSLSWVLYFLSSAGAPGTGEQPTQPNSSPDCRDPGKEVESQPRGEAGLKPADRCRPPSQVRQPIQSTTRREAMMVLTGDVGEAIVIDGRIRITILAINGDEVQLQVSIAEFTGPDIEEAGGQRDPLSWRSPGSRLSWQ